MGVLCQVLTDITESKVAAGLAKLLAYRAVELAMGAVDQRPPPPMMCSELASVLVAGQEDSPTLLQQKLAAKGRKDVARRVAKLAKARHAHAHPDTELAQDVAAAIGGPHAVGKNAGEVNFSTHVGLCKTTLYSLNSGDVEEKCKDQMDKVACTNNMVTASEDHGDEHAMVKGAILPEASLSDNEFKHKVNEFGSKINISIVTNSKGNITNTNSMVGASENHGDEDAMVKGAISPGASAPDNDIKAETNENKANEEFRGNINICMGEADLDGDGLQEAFNLFDTKGSGVIEAAALGPVLLALGCEPTGPTALQLMAELGHTDTPISFDEFSEAFNQLKTEGKQVSSQSASALIPPSETNPRRGLAGPCRQKSNRGGRKTTTGSTRR